MGFKDVKEKVIASLLADDYSHEARQDIDEKNLLSVGKITAAELAEVLKRSRGQEYSSSPHHQDSSVMVHVIVCNGWYVKFYFDPDTLFISVHEEENKK